MYIRNYETYFDIPREQNRFKQDFSRFIIFLNIIVLNLYWQDNDARWEEWHYVEW